MIHKVEQLLDQGLWDKAWRVAQQDLRRSPGDERSKFLNEEVPLKARAKVPWWIDPKQRKRLLHFVRTNEFLQAKRERLSTRGNIRPLELIFDEFSHNLQEFCSQVGKCAESVWAGINDRAKA